MVSNDGDPASVEDLQRAVEELRKENMALRGDGPDPKPRRHRLRGASSWLFIVLACLLALVSIVEVFARNVLLDTDTYVATVAPLASDPAIQSQVANRVSDGLIQRVNVQKRVQDALPPKAGFLAAPVTSGLTSLTHQITLKTVQSDAFQKVWVSVNRDAHKQVVSVLTGSQEGALSSSNGTVSINLDQVETQVKQSLDARGITVFDNVPKPKKNSIVIFQSDTLVKLQGLTRLINSLAYLLPVLAVACFAGGIAVSLNRRRALARAAVALAVTMALVLVGLAFAENQYLSNLGPNQSRAASSAVIDTVTGGLRASLRTTFVVAAIIGVVTMVVGIRRLRAFLGDRRWPAWISALPLRRAVAIHRKALIWVVAAVALIVLIVWPGLTPLVAVVVIVVALALIALTGALAARAEPGRTTPEV